MDADNEKLIQELMEGMPGRPLNVDVRTMLREAISRTQEAARREALLEAADLLDQAAKDVAGYASAEGHSGAGHAMCHSHAHIWSAVQLRRMAEAPTKPSLGVKQIAS